VIEELLGSDEFAVERLHQSWLVGKNKTRRQNPVTDFATAHQRDVGRPVIRQRRRKGEGQILFLPFQNCLHSKVGIVRALSSVTTRASSLADRFTRTNTRFRAENLRPINILRSLSLPPYFPAGQDTSGETQCDGELAAGHWHEQRSKICE